MRSQSTALASTALTANGSTNAVGIPDGCQYLTAFVSVTAVSGTTPSATFTVQVSPDGSTWYDAQAGTALTAAANQRIAVAANIAAFARVSYAITGTTPSFTTSVVIEARGNG